MIIPNCEYCPSPIYQHDFFFEKDLAFLFLFHTGNSGDDNPNLVAQKTMCPVKESPDLEFDKSHGAETSDNEPNLSVTSPSPKDAKVKFDAKNDGNSIDRTATESKPSEEVIVLDKKVEESLLGQPEGGQPASQCCSGASIPEDSPKEDTDVQSQPEGKIKAQPGHDIALFPV